MLGLLSQFCSQAPTIISSRLKIFTGLLSKDKENIQKAKKEIFLVLNEKAELLFHTVDPFLLTPRGLRSWERFISEKMNDNFTRFKKCQEKSKR